MQYDIVKIKEDIINLVNSAEYQELYSYYSQSSFFNILNLSRKETIHSEFLAWLFNSKANHELGDYAIRKLLETLALIVNKFQKTNKENKFPLEIEDIIISGNYDIDNVIVQREKNAGGNGFIDIYIELDVVIQNEPLQLSLVIENKVKSREGDKQTTRYYEWSKKECYKTIFVFLTPLSNAEFENLSEPECECKNYIQLNYQYIVDYIIEPCKRLKIPDEARMFIENYLRTLSYPALQLDTKESERGDIVMAIGERERNLLRNFWEAHKELLIAAISALKDDPEISDEDRISINNGLEAVIKASNKDTSKYSFNGSKYAKNRLVLAVIKKYVEDNPNVTYKELKRIFPDKMQGTKHGVFQSLKSAIEIYEETDIPRHFIKDDEVVQLSDEKIAVCSQWGINRNDEYNSNINKFIRKANELGYLISHDMNYR